MKIQTILDITEIHIGPDSGDVEMVCGDLVLDGIEFRVMIIDSVRFFPEVRIRNIQFDYTFTEYIQEITNFNKSYYNRTMFNILFRNIFPELLKDFWKDE